MFLLNIYYSELFCIGQDPLETVDRMIAAGATHVELMLDGRFWNEFHLHIDSLAEALSQKKVQYAVHTPVWEANLTSENSLIRAAVLESYKQSIVFASRLGADHVVLHPGFCDTPVFDKAKARMRAGRMIDELFYFDTDYHVKLLIENVGTRQTSLYTMEEYIRYCRTLPPGGGALVDIGHAHMNGWDLGRLLTDLGDKLWALHLHDNDGTGDSHLPIGEGTVDWLALATQVKACATCPELILEYDIGTPLAKLTQGKKFLQQHFL
ncbi:MAG: sugar phosphate isomerase/epimerase family protein [Angelakisella sp.]